MLCGGLELSVEVETYCKFKSPKVISEGVIEKQDMKDASGKGVKPIDETWISVHAVGRADAW